MATIVQNAETLAMREAWFDLGAEAFASGGQLAPALLEPRLSVLDALVLALTDHPALLAELWQHGAAGMVGPRH